MNIPVTRNFDKTDIVGKLILRDDIEIDPTTTHLAFTYKKQGKRNVIIEVSLVPDITIATGAHPVTERKSI